MIYQRPESNNRFITIYNYLLSKYYQEYTIKNNGTYNIIKNKDGKVISVNDNLRITYPGNLLIELSPMMGNPIGPFGDQNNYNTTIEGNIQAFIYTMSNLDKVLMTTKTILKNNSNTDISYDQLDEIYQKNKRSHK